MTKPMVVVRSAYSYDRNLNSIGSGLDDFDPGFTQQSAAEEADINTIVRRFGLTGQLPQGIHTPTFADFEDIFDFQSAQNALVEAERSFNAMPAEVRSRFNNDPQKFVEFCSDEANIDELRKLGLADPVKEAPPPVVQDVRIVNPDPPVED